MEDNHKTVFVAGLLLSFLAVVSGQSFAVEKIAVGK